MLGLECLCKNVYWEVLMYEYKGSAALTENKPQQLQIVMHLLMLKNNERCYLFSRFTFNTLFSGLA